MFTGSMAARILLRKLPGKVFFPDSAYEHRTLMIRGGKDATPEKWDFMDDKRFFKSAH